MEGLPRIADVLTARERVGKVILIAERRWFRQTWQLSHVRLVELEPAEQVSLPEMLAHALWLDPTSPQYLPEAWLPNSRFERADSSKLQQALTDAITDIEKESDAEDPLARHLRTLPVEGNDAVLELAGIPGGPKPTRPHQWGPTLQIMWWHGARFHFLEIHNES